ncbi:hypothetical protein ABC963_13185 [Staphylococcus aureus]
MNFNKEKLEHQFQQAMQVGGNFNIEAGGKSAYNNVHLKYMYNNIKHAVKRSQSIQTDFAHRVFLT